MTPRSRWHDVIETMVIEPRVLYGLHEYFVLFPYERGARRSKLIVRCTELAKICQRDFAVMTPFMVGAPLVLAELLESAVTNSTFVPVVYTGRQLHRMKQPGMSWSIRNHRIQPFTKRSFRFETGTRMVFAQHTAFYSSDLLLHLANEGCHEVHSRAGLP